MSDIAPERVYLSHHGHATVWPDNAEPAPYVRADIHAALQAGNARLRELAQDYVTAASEMVGGCSDGNCVVWRPSGQHTNGGCRCTMTEDRARQRQLSRLLMSAQNIARAALGAEKPTEGEMT